jgi:hypothetical protein
MDISAGVGRRIQASECFGFRNPDHAAGIAFLQAAYRSACYIRRMTGAPPDNNPDRRFDFFFGVACGAIIGAGVGLLFAPASGSESRTWIAAHGRTAGRLVTGGLSRQDATNIVRQKGVRGLLAVLRGGADATGPPDTI